METSLAERYVRLGLGIGRHVDGIVDAYFGPPELAAEVDAAPPVDPGALVASADSLLDEVEDGWLRDQLVGLRTYAGVLAGEERPYAEEVEGCFGIRPWFTDESVFAAAHAELEGLLPGDGELAERYERWRQSIRVPDDRVERAVGAAIDVARERAAALVELPEGEGIDLEIVRGEPWLAFNYYQGGLRSRIAVNVEHAISGLELLRLAVHETYPGHHVERVLKEEHLVRRRGLLEETIVLVPTPQSLVAEGIAMLAQDLLLADGDASAFEAVVREAGVEFDLGHALAVERAREPCRWAVVNAAELLHARGAQREEAEAYVARWGLLEPGLAAHVVRFLTEPTSRIYAITYEAGRDLCAAWVGGDPARFRRLLAEQVRVGELRAAAVETSETPREEPPPPGRS